ncbi:MAG TPA: MarR family transcriptional regulator [Gemmatimonadales bacterium]|nr:MarR family transcriptional regulator [Gemmatimonadales bacterium]
MDMLTPPPWSPPPAFPLGAIPIPPPLLALTCACGSVRRASRAITRTYAWELRGTGLNPTQFTLLQALDCLGPITQRALGEALAIQTCTLSRTLSPLERYGWILAHRGPRRRRLRWDITSLGRVRLEAASVAWRRAERNVRGQLDDAISTPLANALSAVTTAAQVALAAM